MHENTWKAMIAAALAAISTYFRVLTLPLIMLVFVMVVDYVTGMAKAWMQNDLNSKVGLKGIVKKIGYLGVVTVAMVIDWLIRMGLAEIGVQFPLEFLAAMLAAIWLIINELISILENLSEMGIPGTHWLAKLLERLRVSVEKKTGEKKEE